MTNIVVWGVLCDVAKIGYWEQITHLADFPGGYVFILISKFVLKSMFEPEQLQYFGLSSGQQGILIQMNDNQKKSFSEIADYIENHIIK